MPVFLVTAIDHTTHDWQHDPATMTQAHRRHAALMEGHIKAYGGRVLKRTERSYVAVFKRGSDPVQCVIKLQQQFANEDWGRIGDFGICAVLHTDEASHHEGDSVGAVAQIPLQLAMSGWAGQILVTPAVRSMVELPSNSSLRDLGTHVLKDFSGPLSVYQLQLPALLPRDFPPLRTLTARPNNLPHPTTSFIGREDGLATIHTTLKRPDCRMLTLVGAGGRGKTRLALHAAAAQIDVFADGVWWVDLDAPELPPELALAATLDIRLQRETPAHTQLVDALRDQHRLLVLDADQQMPVGLIQAILTHAPAVKIIATALERLGIDGERVQPVSGLDMPLDPKIPDAGHYPAVQLFIQRARRIRRSFLLGEDTPCVVHVCRMLNGNPLGIELAAAWLHFMPCAMIADEVEGGLMSYGPTYAHDTLTLRAIIAYAWDLLDDDERAALARLSIFVGGFTTGAAQVVAEVDQTTLAALVEKSLVTSGPRHRLHPQVRQFGATMLEASAEDATRQAHAAYYATLASPTVADWGNFYVGWQWAQHHAMPVTRSLAAALAHVFGEW